MDQAAYDTGVNVCNFAYLNMGMNLSLETSEEVMRLLRIGDMGE